ncbi:MAG: hypothetical protein RMI94_13800 [Bryobacterales bacterium]|nr:hypothetical protein [Bryobacterales bacterium]
MPTFADRNHAVNGASFQPGIAAGGWVTILGSKLTSITRVWRAEEIVDGKLPTALDGVSVTINNRFASVYHISPTQLNVLATDDDSLGPVEVRVRTAQGVSNAAFAQLQPFAPAFFVLDPQGRKYAPAVHAKGTLVGPPSLPGARIATRPAAPGQTILLSGTGSGPTDPPVPASQVVRQAAHLANRLVIRFGNVVATLLFAGLAAQAAGLSEFSVVVPELADGNAPIFAEIEGQPTQEGAFVSIWR